MTEGLRECARVFGTNKVQCWSVVCYLCLLTNTVVYYFKFRPEKKNPNIFSNQWSILLLRLQIPTKLLFSRDQLRLHSITGSDHCALKMYAFSCGGRERVLTAYLVVGSVCRSPVDWRQMACSPSLSHS